MSLSQPDCATYCHFLAVTFTSPNPYLSLSKKSASHVLHPLCLQSLEPFYEQFDPDFINIRKTVREVLQKEDDLNEIVQLVGKVSITCSALQDMTQSITPAQTQPYLSWTQSHDTVGQID